MSVVCSNEAGSASEAAVERLVAMIGNEGNCVKQAAVRELCSGADLQLHAAPGKERLAIYTAWLAGLSDVSLVVVDTPETAESVKTFLSEQSIAVEIATSADELQTMLGKNAGSVVAPIGVASVAFKGAKRGGVAARCIVDSVDAIVSAATLGELESFLLGFRELSPEAQLVLIASEPSLNVSALSRRFLNDPKSCSVKGEQMKEMEHVYYEVGTTLLAKPQALCDLLELEGGVPAIVFCNSPSDADFADVILKKRGISSIKLIGYVPQIKLSKAIQQLQKHEVSTLVLTDVAARGVPLEDFQVVVNYSVPTDPEVYFHRYAAGTESTTKKVISLVAALDIANFHYLKKLGKLEFQKGELPTPEHLFISKFAQLRTQATEKCLLNDPSIAALVEKVLSDASSKEIVALLLHNTVTVLPSLKTASTARDEGSEAVDENESDEDDDGRSHGDRRSWGRQQQGNNRQQRGGRRQQHRSNEFDENDSRGDYAMDDDGGSHRRGGRRGGYDQDRGDRGDRGEREPRQPRQPRRQIIVDKEARLYIGAGSRQGISADKLSGEVAAACGLGEGDIHRVSVRECYSFVDVADAVADQVVTKLSEVDVPNGDSRYFVKKAVTLSIPREGSEESLSSNEGESSAEAMDFGGDDNQPTMLAVDDL